MLSICLLAMAGVAWPVRAEEVAREEGPRLELEEALQVRLDQQLGLPDSTAVSLRRGRVGLRLTGLPWVRGSVEVSFDRLTLLPGPLRGPPLALHEASATFAVLPRRLWRPGFTLALQGSTEAGGDAHSLGVDALLRLRPLVLSAEVHHVASAQGSMLLTHVRAGLNLPGPGATVLEPWALVARVAGDALEDASGGLRLEGGSVGTSTAMHCGPRWGPAGGLPPAARQEECQPPHP